MLRILTASLFTLVLHDTSPVAGIPAARVKGRRSRAKPPLMRSAGMRHVCLVRCFLHSFLLLLENLVPIVGEGAKSMPCAADFVSQCAEPVGVGVAL